MSLKHKLLAAGYYPLRLLNVMRRSSITRCNGRLRVLLYHDIAPWQEERFAAQLRWLSRFWQFLSPDEFASVITGSRELKKDSLLLTFDDGFISNRRVAEKVLNPMGIKGLFFVVSEFAGLSREADYQTFVAQNICPSLQAENVPSHWRNMGWDDLSYLLESGHSIGAHTAHHSRLSQLANNDLEEEIVFSADILEQKLRCSIKHFAYTFGDLGSFSPAALALSRKRFDFIYTGLRGVNHKDVMPWAIRRDAVTADDSFALIGSLLEGGADGFYRQSLQTYEAWGNES